jgi:Zn-dependent protease
MRFDPWVNARVSLAGPVTGGVGAFACLAAAESMDSDFLRALAYTGFLLNLINLAPIGILDGGHVLRSWRVLHAGAGAPTPALARRRANAVAIASILTAVALVAGMLLAHVPQDRL